MKRIFVLAGLMMGLLLSVPSLSTASDGGGIQVERVSGANRYETAVKISQKTFEKADTAIIAYGGNFPYALAGGTLASDIGAPILLVDRSISNVVKDELVRLKVKKVYIIGGTAVVSPSIEKELKRKYTTVRLAGSNRAETSMEVNYERQRVNTGGPAYGGDYSSYFLASGTRFPDALAAAPLIGQMKGQFYDENDPYWSNPTMYLALYTPGGFEYAWYIVGGSSAVPYLPEYETYVDGGIRIAGENRYGTAVELAKMYPKETGKTIDTVVLANGLNYPDALASAPLVSSRDAVLLLTDPNHLSKETKEYIENNSIRTVIITGGDSAVSENVVEEIRNLK